MQVEKIKALKEVFTKIINLPSSKIPGADICRTTILANDGLKILASLDEKATDSGDDRSFVDSYIRGNTECDVKNGGQWLMKDYNGNILLSLLAERYSGFTKNDFNIAMRFLNGEEALKDQVYKSPIIYRLVTLFNQFAREYHAQKCAECGKVDIAGQVWDIIGAYIHPCFGMTKTEIYDNMRKKFPDPLKEKQGE